MVTNCGTTVLVAIWQRLDDATPGPWKAVHRAVDRTEDDDECGGGLGLDIEGPPEAWGKGQYHRSADARFIAHAPEDIALLLDVAEAAQDALICWLDTRGGDIDGACENRETQVFGRLDSALAKLSGEAAP